MRLATWNVNSVTARLPRLLDWLAAVEPDVVCLQETKTAEFPAKEVGALGYEVAAHGNGRWNWWAPGPLRRLHARPAPVDGPPSPGRSGAAQAQKSTMIGA